MKFLRVIYHRYIYGLIGTLLFHILLFSILLLKEIRINKTSEEHEIEIDLLENLPEIEKKDVEKDNKQSNALNGQVNKITNAASNKMATNNITSSTEKFFDNEYQKEVNDAKKLVSEVNSQLAKEKTAIEKIKMPVQTTEGMNPDSIKNIVYAGESNIIYYLKSRYHISLPIPVYLAHGGGKVIVDIVVNKQGNVIKATARAGSKLKDDQILLYAQEAAMRTLFNAVDAPVTQSGSIHYNFIAQ